MRVVDGHDLVLMEYDAKLSNGNRLGAYILDIYWMHDNRQSVM
jgi:hypothetical protein